MAPLWRATSFFQVPVRLVPDQRCLSLKSYDLTSAPNKFENKLKLHEMLQNKFLSVEIHKVRLHELHLKLLVGILLPSLFSVGFLTFHRHQKQSPLFPATGRCIPSERDFADGKDDDSFI